MDGSEFISVCCNFNKFSVALAILKVTTRGAIWAKSWGGHGAFDRT